MEMRFRMISSTLLLRKPTENHISGLYQEAGDESLFWF